MGDGTLCMAFLRQWQEKLDVISSAVWGASLQRCKSVKSVKFYWKPQVIRGNRIPFQFLNLYVQSNTETPHPFHFWLIASAMAVENPRVDAAFTLKGCRSPWFRKLKFSVLHAKRSERQVLECSESIKHKTQLTGFWQSVLGSSWLVTWWRDPWWFYRGTL